MKLKDLVASYLGYDPQSGEPDYTPAIGNKLMDIGSIDHSGLPPLVDEWPDECREAFEERAAIIEFDAEMSRHKAEHFAEVEVREAFQSQRRGVTQVVETGAV